MGRELGDRHELHVLRRGGVQRGHLGMGRELGDELICDV